MIGELNRNDILLGRGMANEQFLSLIEERYEDYSSAQTNAAKKDIAREIVSHIHQIGGRFLKLINSEASRNERVWTEVEESVALEKCKQALRDLRKTRVPSDGNDDRNHAREEDRSQQQNDSGLTIPTVSRPQSLAGVQTSVAAASPLAPGSVQGDPLLLRMVSQPMATNPVPPLEFNSIVTSLSPTNGIAPEYGLAAENVMRGQSNVVEFSSAAAAPLAHGSVQGDPSFLRMASQPIATNFVPPLEFNSNVMLLSPTNGIAPEFGGLTYSLLSRREGSTRRRKGKIAGMR